MEEVSRHQPHTTSDPGKTQMGTESIVVRSMHISDLPQVLDIERRSFSSPWSKRAFKRELEGNRYADYLVADTGEQIVGYAGMWVFGYETHVTNIAVEPDLRRQGIGAQLLLGLMRRASSRNIIRMTLEVRVSNSQAKQFYDKYGFEARGMRTNYYSDTNEDAVIMTCDDVGSVLKEKDRSAVEGDFNEQSGVGNRNLL